jgi:hypothetical protein
MRTNRFPVLVGLSFALAACDDRLGVPNVNDPDVARAYATPAGIEGVIAGLGPQLNNPQRASESVNTQARVLSGENYASVANFGMNVRALIPRVPIDNNLGNNVAGGNLANYNSFSTVARTAANAIAALDRLQAGGGTIGSPARDARAKAFGFLILGQALGYLSFAYDSAAPVTPATPSTEIPGLASAVEVNRLAIRMLDSAIAVAQSPAATTGSDGFPLPSTWINGRADLTRENFVRLVRSYRARIRAGVARTPAERAAVDWNAVIADATNGITADHAVTVGGGSGWSATYDVAQMYVTGGWHQAPMFYYGMGDVSGAYDTWLSQPYSGKVAFLLVTPDRRWPAGASRAAQQAVNPTPILPPGQYFRNRPSGEDVPGDPWGNSQYDHRRYGAVNAAANTGPYVDMSATEIAMLAAEGYIRQGQLTQARALIDASRARAGLPALLPVTSAAQPATEGASCVPRVPQPPSFTATACGTILEAMKWEKRMEVAFTGYMVFFTDGRGWGDLITGTPLEWPVPFQEMQARQQAFYDGTRVAPRGTYGF